MSKTQTVYEIRLRNDKRGVDLLSDALPFGALWYSGPNAADNAVSYAKFYSRSKGALIRVFDGTGKRIEEHQEQGNFKEAG